MFVFGLLVWFSVVVVQIVDWRRLYLPVSFDIDFAPFNWRLDNVGMLAFALAAIGFLFWQLGKEES